MLVSELPIEVTLLIAKLLQPVDKVQCCLVCKAWFPTFQGSLFEKLTIRSDSSINKLTDLTKSPNGLFGRHGHKTRKIEIDIPDIMDDMQLSILQKHLPNVQCFKWTNTLVGTTINGLLFQKYYLHLRRLLCLLPRVPIDLRGWNVWAKSLTDIEITANASDYTELPNIFDLIRSNLRQLKRIHIDSSYNRRSLCTFADFELLNDQLPELTYLFLNVQLDKMGPAELSKIKEVKPRPCLKTFGMSIEDTAGEWLYYIAAKYPNISTLKAVNYTVGTLATLNFQALSMLSELSCPFQQLENIDVNIGNSTEEVYLAFMSQLCRSNVQMKTFYLGFTSINKDDIRSRNTLEPTQSCADTLERIKITSFQADMWCMGKSINFECYPNLVHLDLQMDQITIILDMLLRECPALETLSMVHGFIVCRPGSFIFPTDHALCNLFLKDVDVSAKTLKMFATSCKKLSSMKLELVRLAVSSRRTDTLETFIDMSSIHFSELRFEKVKVFNIVNKYESNMIKFSSSMVPTENIWLDCQHSIYENHKHSSLKLNNENEDVSKKVEDLNSSLTRAPAEDANDDIDENKDVSSVARWISEPPEQRVTFKYGSLKKFVFKGKQRA
ncbi:hypothetical protein J3Q64DRAFT_1737116 [Phycomyces blakesleeanus]